MFRWGLALFVLVAQLGCAWRIAPPAAVEEPAGVFVTVYGRHTRLALPAPEDKQLIEYGFGDWRFYALEERGPISGLRALFWSRSSALSRRELPWRDETGAFERVAGGVRSERVIVERGRADALRERLESRWRELEDEEVYQPREQMVLRKSDDPYHLLRNSNHQTADWLRELGCTVSGVTIGSRFRVIDPQEENVPSNGSGGEGDYAGPGE